MRKMSVVLLCFGLAVMSLAAQDTARPSKATVKLMLQETIARAYAESFRQEAVGKYAEAVRALAEVYETYPKSYTVNYRMGWLYYCNRNYADALAGLERALIACPTSVEALNVQNLVFVARSEWTSVEAQSLRILKIDYYNLYANGWYAVALRMQGKHEYAIQVCRKMIAILPTSVQFLQELAANLFLAGEKTESRAVFEAVLVLDPNNETAKAYLKKY